MRNFLFFSSTSLDRILLFLQWHSVLRRTLQGGGAILKGASKVAQKPSFKAFSIIWKRSRWRNKLAAPPPVFLQGEEWQPPPTSKMLSDVEPCREEEQVEERACRLGLSSGRLFFKVKVLIIWCFRF